MGVGQMREYIDKQDLIEYFFMGVSEEEARKENIGEIITFEEIDRIPTYTQADLESLAYNRGARAFAENMKSKIKTCAVLRMKDIDEILEEMGCCDGKKSYTAQYKKTCISEM